MDVWTPVSFHRMLLQCFTRNKEIQPVVLTGFDIVPDCRCVSRRCTTVRFTLDDATVVVADKSGDVFRFSVSKPQEEGELLLGHLSMVLDMVSTLFCVSILCYHYHIGFPFNMLSPMMWLPLWQNSIKNTIIRLFEQPSLTLQKDQTLSTS